MTYLLVPRIDNVEEFARRSRVVLLQHQTTGVGVDLSLGALPFEVEAVERGQLHAAGELEIRLPTPEDLIIQKAVAHRPKDLLDIESIAAAYPQLDWERIRYWVEQFAEVLDAPDLWRNVARFRPKVSPKARQKKRKK